MADRPTRDEDYCELSFLPHTWCGHCLGHELDAACESMVQVNLR